MLALLDNSTVIETSVEQSALLQQGVLPEKKTQAKIEPRKCKMSRKKNLQIQEVLSKIPKQSSNSASSLKKHEVESENKVKTYMKSSKQESDLIVNYDVKVQKKSEPLNKICPRKIKKPRKTAQNKNQTQISIDQTSSVEIQQSQAFAENWISKPEVLIGFNKLWDLNLKPYVWVFLISPKLI